MSVVEEIKDRLDILEVIQPYVPLKKAGRTYKGICPFHAEKTPSFVVFPETGTWHCFGACAEGGDIFTFVMKRENLDFGEALKMLAQRAGVELEPRSPQVAEAEQQVALLREINRAAANYFHHLLLHSDEARQALAYLESRGLERATIESYQLGYALQQWDGLLRYLISKGYQATDVAEAGLIIEREDKSGYYDRFRKRIIFPIRDHQGQTIGFGGRVLDGSVPKYLNSPQTPIFDKSSVLFGLDQAKQGIRTAGQAVIVEGYMDVLMAHQHGINNIVAQMGTALTEQQLRRLKRYTQQFVLALDADQAGDQATLRGLDVARQVMDREVVPVPTPRGLIRFEDRLAADIRIASLPAGRDPDEVIRESPARWVQLVAEAKPLMDYYFQALTADLDLATARGKADAVRALGPLIAEQSDQVQRTHYLQQLVRMVQSDERTVWAQIQRTGVRPQHSGHKRAASTASSKRSPGQPDTTILGLDAHCLSYVLYYPHLLAPADEALLRIEEQPLRDEDLSSPQDRAILDAWRRWLAGGQLTDVRAEFYDTMDEQLQSRLDRLLQAREGEPPAPDDLLKDKVVDAIAQLRLRCLQRRNFELRFLLQDAQESGDRLALRRYGQLNIDLSKRIGRLQKAVNERSISGRRQREDVAPRMLLAEE